MATGSSSSFITHDKVELYNLVNDIGEQKNLAARQPKKTAELRAKLRAWQKSMKAKMPVPNPAYKAPAPNSK